MKTRQTQNTLWWLILKQLERLPPTERFRIAITDRKGKSTNSFSYNLWYLRRSLLMSTAYYKDKIATITPGIGQGNSKR